MIKYLVWLLLLLPLPAEAKTLYGGTSKSKEVGMVGLTRGFCNKIVRVIFYSPAWENGLLPGDIIISVDGKKSKSCIGTPGEYAIIKIKRKDLILTKTVKRSPESQIDKLANKHGYMK